MRSRVTQLNVQVTQLNIQYDCSTPEQNDLFPCSSTGTGTS